MDMIGRQKALADRVDWLLNNAGIDCLLAGGAPRDWHMGLEANDLDFYIQTKNPTGAAEAVSNYLDIALEEKKGDNYDNLVQEEKTLLAVYEGEFMGQKVQFMFITVPPKQFVEDSFDLSICKVWYENGEIGMGWGAELSFEEKVALVCGGRYNRHIDKVLERDAWSTFWVAIDWKNFLHYMERKQKRRPLFVNEIDINQMQVEF